MSSSPSSSSSSSTWKLYALSFCSCSARYPVGDSPVTSSHWAASILLSISAMSSSSGINSCSSALYCLMTCFISAHLTIHRFTLVSKSSLEIGCCPLLSLCSKSFRISVILLLALMYVSATLPSSPSSSEISIVGWYGGGGELL